jgi:valyl-tRNA synthetase
MTEISTKYEPSSVENKWYGYWIKHDLFKSVPDSRKSFTVVIPPPNVTGVLHMGHMLNNTIQDVLVRRARMKGLNACWVPGTDHASIATEAKVVAKLKAEGIEKSNLTREQFLEHAWAWKEKHGGIILEQLKKLGASCDWGRTKFTMDNDLSQSVLRVFVDLYRKGKIYRGVRMVNWDPQAQTTVSDEEVIYTEEQSKLYHLSYPISGQPGKSLTIATTRPETILGDTAVCVNPADERYAAFVGMQVEVPLCGRKIPVIADDYVDMEFGTGCLKITPAHDPNDYLIGDRYGLESIDIFNADGTMSDNAGMYVGMDRFEVRKAIEKDLSSAGFLVKTEDYINKVGRSERTQAVIEPKLSMQWFLQMPEISKPALDAVINDKVRLHPAKFKNVYRHWMENVKDWCISRQLWWGQQIPAYFIKETNNFVVAESIGEAIELAIQKTGDSSITANDLRQDEDVLDTWFSSWLWPITVFNGILEPDNKDFKYYYPTNDLVTGPDILFFWVARMIIAGYEYGGTEPFTNVYLTGMVRDKQRRKMSKSLGNSPDPLDLISKYGADGVRVGMLLCAPAGGDLLFDESLVEQGRNFSSKIWNAYRLVQGWECGSAIEQPESSKQACIWFGNKLAEAFAAQDELFAAYRVSEALMAAYKLFWDEFSGWYLEAVKPAYQQPIDKKTLDKTLGFFEQLMVLMHPYVPFITEEIWQRVQARSEGESICNVRMMDDFEIETSVIEDFEQAKEIITGIRSARKSASLPMKETAELLVAGTETALPFSCVISKLANLSVIKCTTEPPKNAFSFRVKAAEYFVPSANVNSQEELAKLSKELDHAQKFSLSVSKKLSNEKFVASAPEEVVSLERKKLADACEKIEVLKARIAELS